MTEKSRYEDIGDFIVLKEGKEAKPTNITAIMRFHTLIDGDIKSAYIECSVLDNPRTRQLFVSIIPKYKDGSIWHIRQDAKDGNTIDINKYKDGIKIKLPKSIHHQPPNNEPRFYSTAIEHENTFAHVSFVSGAPIMELREKDRDSYYSAWKKSNLNGRYK